MKKQEMIRNLAEKLEVSQVKVNEILKGLDEFIAEVVENEDEVTICGMKIATREVAARKGKIDNKLGCYEYETPAKVIPTVKFVKSVKDKLSKEL